MDHTTCENFTSNCSAVVLAIVGGVMVRFVCKVVSGAQKSIRKLCKLSTIAIVSR